MLVQAPKLDGVLALAYTETAREALSSILLGQGLSSFEDFIVPVGVRRAGLENLVHVRGHRLK